MVAGASVSGRLPVGGSVVADSVVGASVAGGSVAGTARCWHASRDAGVVWGRGAGPAASAVGMDKTLFKRVVATLSPSEKEAFNFVAVTMDPARDTPEVLAKYARELNTLPREVLPLGEEKKLTTRALEALTSGQIEFRLVKRQKPGE